MLLQTSVGRYFSLNLMAGALADVRVNVGQEANGIPSAANRLPDERSFAALVAHFTDSVALLDAHGTVLYASPAMSRTLGYVAGEYLGHNAFAGVHPEDQPAVRTLF